MINNILLIRKLIFFIILILTIKEINAQNANFHKYEDSLKYANKAIINSGNAASKKKANEKYLELFQRALNLPNSYNYPFDSVVTISKLISPDNNFRIFTWASVNEEGKYNYYGFIQMKSGVKNLFKLIDKSDSLKNPNDIILSYKEWYGAVYYKIIMNTVKNNKYYTVLGWQGENLSTRKKLIDVITFNKENIPSFGASIFKTDKTEQNRILFEYSANAVMSLKYEQQYYNKVKGQSIYAYDRLNKKTRKLSKKKKTAVKKKKANMIVFDRLTSLTPGFENQYQFYVPSLDYVDGYIFKSGKWRMIYDIDARNPKK